jgi:transmembrane sensor
MSSPESNRISAIEDQAALWAAKLDGSSLSSTDRAELDVWLAKDPQHRATLSQYCQFSADLEERLPALVISGAVKLPAEATEAPRRSWRMAWFATGLAAAAAIAVAVWPTHSSQQVESVATSVAQRKTLDLSDGSRVELNARTSLLVELGAKERHVRMADGEAFFTIAKDPSRPFIIDTPAGSVRVTGTVFNVHAETSAELKVTVVEGSVRVQPGLAAGGASSEPAQLRARDELTARAGTTAVHQLSEGDLENALAWRQGYIVFEGTPLRDALAQLSRYHGRTITADSAIADQPIGGRFRLDDLDVFLQSIQDFLPVRVSTDSSGAIAVTPRAGSEVAGAK